jgi:hypothetical protein
MLCLPVMAQTAPAAPAHDAAATHTFHDPTYKLSFGYPVNWNFSATDHEISTFHLDARSAPASTVMRAVVAMPENPFPASTFSGAYFYFSVTPRASSSSCMRQAAPPAGESGTANEAVHVAGIPFTRGRDEQKGICTTQRDEIYTAYHQGACYRFDLSINNFCGGEVSGVKDITPKELDQVWGRLEFILNTVRFDVK